MAGFRNAPALQLCSHYMSEIKLSAHKQAWSSTVLGWASKKHKLLQHDASKWRLLVHTQKEKCWQQPTSHKQRWSCWLQRCRTGLVGAHWSTLVCDGAPPLAGRRLYHSVGHSDWPNYPLFMYSPNTDSCYMWIHLTQPSGHSQGGLAQQASPLHLEFQKLLQNSAKGKQ